MTSILKGVAALAPTAFALVHGERRLREQSALATPEETVKRPTLSGRRIQKECSVNPCPIQGYCWRDGVEVPLTRFSIVHTLAYFDGVKKVTKGKFLKTLNGKNYCVNDRAGNTLKLKDKEIWAMVVLAAKIDIVEILKRDKTNHVLEFRLNDKNAHEYVDAFIEKV